MATLQNELITFHNTIKVSEEDLRTSRDALLAKIKSTLSENKKPVPQLINQGSYAYKVGITPIGDLEYDIDVGLEFNISVEEYPDAKEVRDWVFAAVKNHTKNPPIKKGPCIRVPYQAGYHVDLVIYSKYLTNKDKENDREIYRLGFKNGEWRPSEPKKLKQIILDSNSPFSGTNVSGSANQLQRVTRYLKRWNDINNPNETDDKPVGLALLLYTINNLTPCYDKDGNPDDLEALKTVCKKAKDTIGRISCKKPTEEFEDIFGRISLAGMNTLKERFSKLFEAIVNAAAESDIEEACGIMASMFGDDFPITKAKVDESSAAFSSALGNAVASAKNPSPPWSFDL